MATTFLDNFNRANGPIGDSWTMTAGSFVVNDNAMTTSVVNSLGHPASSPISPNQAVRVWVRDPGAYPKTVRLRCRWNPLTDNYLSLTLTLAAASLTANLGPVLGGVGAWTASRTMALSWDPMPSFVLSFAQQTALVVVNDTLLLAAFCGDIPDLGFTGISIGSTNTKIEEYWQISLADAAGALTIVDIEPESGKYELTIQNAGADWTPGNPGSPLFSARAGTVENQIIDDADTARLGYIAPTILSDDAIVDPNNGYSWPFVVGTLGAIGEGGSGEGLTPAQAETLDWWHELLAALRDAPEYSSNFYVQLLGMTLSTQQHYGGSPNAAIDDMFAAILSATEGVGAIHQIVQSTWDRLDWVTDYGDLDLNTVQNNIRGPNLHSIADVLDAIAAIEPGNNQDVLNELAVIRTANLWTLGTIVDLINGLDIPPEHSNQDVLDELARIRTANNWSLGTIVDLIDGLVIPDYSATLTDIHADIAAIPTNPVTSLQPVLDAVDLHNDNLNTQADLILDAIGAIPTNPITSLQTVLDAISNLDGDLASARTAILDAIGAIEGGAGTLGPPVWPGLSSVTLGTPVAIDTGVTIIGNMHGVIVNLTNVPPETERYMFDDEPSYVHVGALAFSNDDGAIEGFQPFSFGKHILTPTRLARASACHVRAGVGITGTIVPWTITPS